MHLWKRKTEPQPRFLPPSARTKAMEDAIEAWQAAFHGQPNWLSRKRPRSLNLAAASTYFLSRLVCAELEMKAEGNGSEREKWLSEAISREIMPQLPQALQQAMAAGAVVLKPYVEAGKVKLEWLSADQFYPLQEGGMAFLSYVHQDKLNCLRVETQRFEDGLYHITNRAYVCDDNGRIKRPIALENCPQWADLEEEVIIENLQMPLYSIWKMPFSNTVDGSGEAVSLYANCGQIMEDIDRLYNDYCYEFASARRKMILREDALRLKSDGSPVLPHSDGADDVFLPMDLPGESSAFGDYTPEIRESSYHSAINQLLRLFELQCGLSAGSFSMEEGAALTATEVISKDRKSYYTVKAIQQEGKMALESLFDSLHALAELYGIGGNGPCSVRISFGDGIFEDTESEFQRRLKLVELGMKPELLLAWYFDATEESAEKMMKKEETKDEFLSCDAVGGTGKSLTD